MVEYVVLALAAAAVGLVVFQVWAELRLRAAVRLAQQEDEARDTVPSVLWPSTWGSEEVEEVGVTSCAAVRAPTVDAAADVPASRMPAESSHRRRFHRRVCWPRGHALPRLPVHGRSRLQRSFHRADA